MVKILIADDHAVVREGLKRILADTPDLVVAGEAGDGRETLERVRAEEWGTVVLDLSMPGCNGLDVLKQLRRERPDMPVLVLSVHPEDQYAVRVLKAGASGYLTKESAPDQLIAAVRKVAKGGKFVGPGLAERLGSPVDRGGRVRAHEVLSDREYQVLCMIASGISRREIAGRLSLSVKTVSTYRNRIFKKMGMKSSAELARYAAQKRLEGP